ncbi:MAG: DNA gyrase inhibitor YacG [Pseudomonadota bacterium]
MCSKETVQKYRPFCSKRCADLDLGKWMSGEYAVASQNEDDAEELVRELDKAMRERAEDDASKLH